MTSLPYPYTFLAALVLSSVYIFGHKLRARSHRRWVSIAAGVSVAWVFIDLLPEIAEGQERFSTGSHRGLALFPEQTIFVAAMLGFVLFYGLECMVSASAEEKEPSLVFSSLRIAAFAGYSSLIAYLLIHNPWRSVPALLLYSLAMAFHFLLVCHSLFSDRNGTHLSPWQWTLALSVMVGWFAGILTSIPEQWLARITGFVCGGVIMNTLVVELPEGRGGLFWPFVLAALAYSLVLIIVLG